MNSLVRTQQDPKAGVTALWFIADGWVPNNQRLPVLLYRQAIPAASDRAAACEELFDRNGWPPQWRNGIYPFHHYHSTAHEALGIASGNARVLLGGPNGKSLEVSAGDCVLLPMHPDGIEHKHYNYGTEPAKWLAFIHIPTWNHVASELTQIEVSQAFQAQQRR